MATNTFSPWDYVVFVAVLVVSAGIGLYHACSGGKQRTTQEFLMADRKMTILPVSLSLLASFMSAITLLGTPAEAYLFGTQYMIVGVAYCFVMVINGWLFVPVFYHLKLTSVYEYLEMRFRKKIIRIIAVVIYIIQMTLYLSIVLYAPSLALSAVTGLNVWASVFSVGVVCTFYTTLGGMKAVMWTDVFQIVIMVAGLLAVVIQGSIDQGGFANVWNIAQEGQRIELFNIDPRLTTRHTVWSLVIGGTFTWLAIYAVNQSQVQRALTCPSLRNAQIAMVVNAPGLIVLLVLTIFCGLLMYGQYKDCDPLLNHEIGATDQMLPFYAMEVLGDMPGLPGLLVACVFSGSLSSISSGLNSLAAVTIQDLIRGHCCRNVREDRATIISKCLAFGYGAVMIALTFVAAQLGSVLQAALALFGILGGPLLGIFTLGLFWPRANWKGAISGFFVSLIALLWIGLGGIVNKPSFPAPSRSTAGCPTENITQIYNATHLYVTAVDDVISDSHWTVPTTAESVVSIEEESRSWLMSLYSLSYMWYSLLGVILVLIVGIIVSAVFASEEDKYVDPRTISPLCRRLCCGVHSEMIGNQRDPKQVEKEAYEKEYLRSQYDASTKNSTDDSLLNKHKKAESSI